MSCGEVLDGLCDFIITLISAQSVYGQVCMETLLKVRRVLVRTDTYVPSMSSAINTRSVIRILVSFFSLYVTYGGFLSGFTLPLFICLGDRGNIFYSLMN